MQLCIHGLPFEKVCTYLQVSYNRGVLKLDKEQIENLKKNGFLKYSKSEMEEISKQYEMPKNIALEIHKKFGSKEAFIEAYKKGLYDYNFEKEKFFVGFRGITISTQDITEKKKMGYANLICAIIGKIEYEKILYNENDDKENSPSYIDIDEIERQLAMLTEREQSVLRMHCFENYNLLEIRSSMGLSVSMVRQIEYHALKKLRSASRTQKMIINIEELKKTKLENEEKISEYERNIGEWIIFLNYCIDQNGELKKEIENVEISQLDISEEFIQRAKNKEINVLNEIIDKKIAEVKEYGKLMISIDELELSVRAYNCLKRKGISYVKDLVSMSREDLMKIKNLGKHSLEEILYILKDWGLKLREEEKKPIIENAEETEIDIEEYDIELEENKSRFILNKIKEAIEIISVNIKSLEIENKEINLKMENYFKAIEFYLNEEEIFNPDAIVPKIEKIQTEELQTEEFEERDKKINILMNYFKAIETYINTKNIPNQDIIAPEYEYECENEKLNMKIIELELSVRTYNCLNRKGIKYVRELIALSEKDVMEIRGVGKRTFEEILNKVADLGLRLREEEEEETSLNEEDIPNQDVIVPEYEKLNIKISELELSSRTYNCLNRKGIKYVKELISLSKKDVMEIRGVGIRTFEEILNKVADLGLRLREEEEEENQLIKELEQEEELNMMNVTEKANIEPKEKWNDEAEEKWDKAELEDKAEEEISEFKENDDIELEETIDETNQNKKQELLKSIEQLQNELEQLKRKLDEIEKQPHT